MIIEYFPPGNFLGQFGDQVDEQVAGPDLGNSAGKTEAAGRMLFAYVTLQVLMMLVDWGKLGVHIISLETQVAGPAWYLFWFHLSSVLSIIPSIWYLQPFAYFCIVYLHLDFSNLLASGSNIASFIVMVNYEFLITLKVFQRTFYEYFMKRNCLTSNLIFS